MECAIYVVVVSSKGVLVCRRLYDTSDSILFSRQSNDQLQVPMYFVMIFYCL